VGVVGIAVGTVTGLLALSNDCSHGACKTGDAKRDDGLIVAHISTVAFIVGGAGLALGAVGLLISTDSTDNHHRAAMAVRIGPGHAALLGRF